MTGRCALGPEETWRGSSFWECVCVREGGVLVDDARPSRDRELQSDAALGAVVTPFWVPAPRCPAHSGLMLRPGKRGR